MHRLVIFVAFLVLSLTVVTAVSAQETCGSFVQQALTALSNNCSDLSRNSACYGYNNVSATFFQPFTPDAFKKPNDRVDLAAIQSITTMPMDLQTSEWGIAVMKAQANLPDALPGQAVTFLLLGDVHVTTGVETGSDQKPMQAIYFTTGIGDTKCSDAPASSLIIQGPKDITVDLRVNGADIKLGSTAIFRSTENNTMSCGVLDGAAHVGDTGQVIPAGFAARVPLDQSLNANGDWGGNQPLPTDDTSQLQVLREVPDGVLNYTPDVPTAPEVSLMMSLDQSMLWALDPHVMRQMIRDLLAEGATPEMAAEWDIPTMRSFLANNAAALTAATPEAATPEVSATEEPSPTLQSVLDAIDAYLAQQGG